METYGNVFRDREESGPVLFLPCVRTHIHTHTHTHTFPARWFWLPGIIKRYVLYGVHCLCKENITMSNHLSSFKAILIFFPDLTIAGTKRV